MSARKKKKKRSNKVRDRIKKRKMRKRDGEIEGRQRA